MLIRRAEAPPAAELRPPDQTLASPAYRFAIEPATGERGVIAYIPTEPLPRGPNELSVGALGRDGMRLPEFVIPFCK